MLQSPSNLNNTKWSRQWAGLSLSAQYNYSAVGESETGGERSPQPLGSSLFPIMFQSAHSMCHSRRTAQCLCINMTHRVRHTEVSLPVFCCVRSVRRAEASHLQSLLLNTEAGKSSEFQIYHLYLMISDLSWQILHPHLHLMTLKYVWRPPVSLCRFNTGPTKFDGL